MELIQNRKLKCECIPYCHVQFNLLLKCVLLHLSTQIFISCVYTFWVVRASDEEMVKNSVHLTVFFTSKHSLSVPQSALISLVWLHQVQLHCIQGVLVLRLWHLLRNVMNAVCTILTALYLHDLHPDNLLHPDAWDLGWCLYLDVLSVWSTGSGTLPYKVPFRTFPPLKYWTSKNAISWLEKTTSAPTTRYICRWVMCTSFHMTSQPCNCYYRCTIYKFLSQAMYTVDKSNRHTSWYIIMAFMLSDGKI